MQAASDGEASFRVNTGMMETKPIPPTLLARRKSIVMNAKIGRVITRPHLPAGEKVRQQGHRPFGARSVHVVREHDKGPRTTLADFFNILLDAVRRCC